MASYEIEPLGEGPIMGPYLSKEYSRLPDSPQDQEVEIFDGIYKGGPAYYFTAKGADLFKASRDDLFKASRDGLEIALTREATSLDGRDYTYRFHYKDAPYGEVDVHYEGDMVCYLGEGITENIRPEERTEANGRLLLSMLLLPLAFRKDFPNACLIDDGYGDLYSI